MSGQIERADIFKPAEESSEREVLEAQPSKANSVIADKIVESSEDLGSETDVSNTIDLKVYLFTCHWSNSLDLYDLYDHEVYKPNVLLILAECFFLAEQDDMVSHLEILEVCPIVENGSSFEMRSSGTISSAMLDQENQENHQPKNVWT